MPFAPLSRAAVVVAGLAAAAAGCAPDPLDIPAGCSPLLSDVDCGVPYPSDFYLVDDPSTPTGKRIHFEDAAKLITEHGLSADVTDTTATDGFSPVTPIVFAFGTAVDQASMPALFDDATATTTKGFHTALIDAATGERIPHFIDVDPYAADGKRQALIMHVLVRLKEKTRYVVAVSGLKGESGKEVAPPEAFRRMRDNNVGDDPVLKPLLARYETDIFPVLDKDGLDRGALQLAWDFTTGSDELAMRDMLGGRALALAALDAAPPVITVDSVFEGDAVASIVGNDHPELTWRIIRGTVTAPRIVETNEPGTLLHRDADGNVALNGTTTFPFTAIVPASVRDGFDGGAPMMFGHGFFGDQGELEGIAARSILDHAGVVGFAVDWQGMSVDDIGHVVEQIGGDVSGAIDFGDRVMQAMVNWMTVTRAVKLGLFTEDPAFQRPTDPALPGVVVDPNDASQDNAGQPVVDLGKPMGYLGISLGHVLGGTLSALDPDIERNMLMVGGAAFSTMMYRARPFDRFRALLAFTVPDALDQQKLAAQMQSPFDRFDPATFAPYVVGKDLPVGPTNHFERRHVLEMFGIGDPQVPNVASELHARIMGIPLMAPAAGRPTFGLESADYPRDGSGVVIYDLGVDDSFYAQAESGDANIVHEGVRRVPQALDMMKEFLANGDIVDACGGACVVDPSALDIPGS